MALPLPQTQQKVLMQTIVLNIAVFLKEYNNNKSIIASTTKKEEPLSTDEICAVPCRKIHLKSESAWMQNFYRLKGCEIYFLSVLLLLFCYYNNYFIKLLLLFHMDRQKEPHTVSASHLAPHAVAANVSALLTASATGKMLGNATLSLRQTYCDGANLH